MLRKQEQETFIGVQLDYITPKLKDGKIMIIEYNTVKKEIYP